MGETPATRATARMDDNPRGAQERATSTRSSTEGTRGIVGPRYLRSSATSRASNRHDCPRWPARLISSRAAARSTRGVEVCSRRATSEAEIVVSTALYYHTAPDLDDDGQCHPRGKQPSQPPVASHAGAEGQRPQHGQLHQGEVALAPSPTGAHAVHQ